MILIGIIGLILTACITILLFESSYEDMFQRTIGSWHVILVFILVALHSVTIGSLSIETTFVFIFALLVFLAIAVFSMGHFGIGDAMVIGALAWYFGTWMQLQFFLYTLGIVSILWLVVYAFILRKENGFKDVFSGFKKTLPIDDVRPGMVLVTDNFMQGLSQIEIDQMKKEGCETANVKFPLPFIPVIFLTFLATLLHTL